MRKFNALILGLLVGFMFVATSCSDDDDDSVNEAQALVEYLEANGDYANTYLPSIITAEGVKTALATNSVYVIDIRAAEDYNLGHIPGAVNVAVGDIVSHMENTDLSGYDKVAVVCYTGQTAGFAVSLLQLSGYDNVSSMKFGMCSWHADFAGKWNSNISNQYATQFTTDATEKGPAGDLPKLETGETEGADILSSRVTTTLAEGFGEAAITNAAVFDEPDSYYIVNYWAESDYTKYGSIPGAMQYTPKESMALATDLKTLPTDKTIVVYCWTGQTSAFMTAFLRTLGYDAKSLKFGANGMIYDNLESHKWSEGAIMGYDYETTE